MNNKFIWGAIAVVFIVAVIALFTGGKQSLLAGITAYDTVSAAGLQIGSGCSDALGTCTGTTITQILKGTCALVGANVSHAATTTKPYDCAVTGVVSGDTVQMEFATSTANTYGTAQWVIVSATASSTSGYVTALVMNLSGTAQALSANSKIASSTSYIILR